MGKVLDFKIRGDLILEARKQGKQDFMMIVAAEHERIAQNAARLGAAMDRLSVIPSDTEGE